MDSTSWAPRYEENREHEYRNRFVAARKALDISREELAALILTPLQTLIQWETGRHRTPGIAVAAVEFLCECEGVEIGKADGKARSASQRKRTVRTATIKKLLSLLSE